MNRKIKIGITDCVKYANYEKWFLAAPENVEVVKLSYHLNNAAAIEDCDGLVLSGGEDVHPEFYNKPEYLAELNAHGINEQRDYFEWTLIEKALTLQVPVLGICRGLQLMNVFLGGTLVPDIPSYLNILGHEMVEGIDQRHAITVSNHSLLQQITGTINGEINSAHHQSVDQPAKELAVIAQAEPLLVEALQWKEPDNKSWLLLVQWHPERMPDQENPFSMNIRNAFIKSCHQ